MKEQMLLLILLVASCWKSTTALEIKVLSSLFEKSISPLDYNVRTIFTPERRKAYLFGNAIKIIRADEELLNELIFNIESSTEFIIKTRFRIFASPGGVLFSIVHRQRKLFLMELSSKGSGDKTKLIFKYRSTNDTTEAVVFKEVGSLVDRGYHTVVIRITDVKDNGKKISALSLFVDCQFAGRVDTKSAISDIFSYRGTLLSLLDFRIAQRGFGSKSNSKWRGAIESLSFIFKRSLDSVLGGPDCESAVKEGVKAPQPPEINDISVITHEVATELMGLIRDIRYDLSMQVAEIKYLRRLVENCQMCRVQDFCRFKPCFPGVPCFNDPSTVKGFECGECPLGMIGDGVNCSDVDECHEEDPCAKDVGVICQNRSPGYWCPPCPKGYSGREIHGIGLYFARNNKQICVDIDECAETPRKCAEQSRCNNSPGSYDCSPCPEGFTGDPRHACYHLSYCDPNDPRSNPCNQHAKCIRLQSGRNYKCECRPGYAGEGHLCAEDGDLDGFPDIELNCTEKICRKDNCPRIPNLDQKDLDEDGIGDVCDEDLDGDNVNNDVDNCPHHYNAGQSNVDGDPFGDECDNCPYVTNKFQGDIDKDGIGDVCDKDVDGDGVLNSQDNCPVTYNPQQEDRDGDTVGDKCDNCPSTMNSKQIDRDSDGLGNNCDLNRDDDNDGVDDMIDNCRGVTNPDQIDNDQDQQGDACDDDDDDDGVPDRIDNCQLVPNPTQRDLNGNGLGDPCDGDFDGDKIPDYEDACSINHHVTHTDFTNLIKIDLSPTERQSRPPIWAVDGTGTKVSEEENSDPGIAVGNVRFNGVDFNGTLRVSTKHDDDFVGLVFSYQNNRQFYVISWKQEDQVYWDVQPFRAKAVKGIQIKLIDSKTGPGFALRNALWHSGDVDGESKEIWRDSKERAWKDETDHEFRLMHRPSIGLIKLVVYVEGEILVDTGYIIDKTLKGGKVGMYVFSQGQVLWKNLSYRCSETIPEDYQAL
ncbi:cartilage oligomeric matrix protein-like isoform X2 [Pocillopora damicornis]|uniref:cartilage oligomeric matrix protein-like isoform X2 n=1 Tax=Pocillopora damicornis TaxID=46731 RepID=UPI000F54EF71|nr:cartilage oligomeric matrix protein-like isoform X2 [Pocillopora damicornis]